MKYLPFQSEEAMAAIAGARRAVPGIAALSFMIALFPVGLVLFILLALDVALPGQSYSTLAGLMLMLIVMIGFQAAFLLLRRRMLTRTADIISESLTPRLDVATAQLAEAGRGDTSDGMQVARDLDAIQHFLRSGTAARWIDMAGLVVAVLTMAFLHYWLGIMLIAGAAGLALFLRNSVRAAREPMQEMVPLRGQRHATSEIGRQHTDSLRALGMRQAVQRAWTLANARLDRLATRWLDGMASRHVAAQMIRILMFAIILATGTVLAMDNRASAAVAVAGALLSWLALEPFVQAFASIEQFVNAQQGWVRLDTILHSIPAPAEPVALPAPRAKLSCEHIALAAPGLRRPLLHSVHFTLDAGQALAVIGPSGCGKSTLMRGLAGAWPISAGKVRLDSAALDQWDDDMLGRHIGYLPQSIDLLTGTVAENVARFDPGADAQSVVKAAQDAGVHDMIVRLPEGYSTQIGPGGNRLSLSQAQRIGLARAFYGEPFLLVLDTPTAHCDAGGEKSFMAAVAEARARGAIVVMAGTQTCVLNAASHVLVLRGGTQNDFGEKEELRQRLQDQRKPEEMTRGTGPQVSDPPRNAASG